MKREKGVDWLHGRDKMIFLFLLLKENSFNFINLVDFSQYFHGQNCIGITNLTFKKTASKKESIEESIMSSRMIRQIITKLPSP